MAGPGGQRVGEVHIKVSPDIDGFRKKVERALKGLDDHERVKVDGDFDDLDKELDKRKKDHDGGKIKYDTELDNKTLGAKAKAAAAAASRHSVHFRTKLDSSGVLRDAFMTSKGIQNLLSQNPWKFSAESLSLKKLWDVGGLHKSTRAAHSELRAMFSTLKAIKALSAFKPESMRLLRMTGTVGTVTKGLAKMGSAFARNIKVIPSFAHSLRGFTSQASFAASVMGAVAGSALGIKAAVVGVGSVLGYVVDGVKQLSGSLLLLPGAFGAMGMVAATVFAGFRGMGNALSAAIDPTKDLESEIAGLAPSAQAFARAVRGITPAWKDVAKQVQGRLFAGLGDQLTRLSEKQLPTVSKGMNKVAESTNHVMSEFGRFAAHERTTKALNKGFTATAGIMRSIGAATTNFMLALQDIGVVGVQALNKYSAAWPGLSAKFSAWTENEDNQRKMSKWIDDSIQGFKDLGSTVGNLYSSFKQIGNAFGVDFGSDAISKFEKATQKFQGWLGTADDADSRISKFANKVENLSAPWMDAGKNAWDKLVPAARKLSPFIETVSNETAEMFTNIVDKAAPQLDKLFTKISDNKDWLGPLTAGLVGLRLGLGVFKLGRMLVSPFLSAITGTVGAVGKLGKAFWKLQDFKDTGGFGGWREGRREKRAANQVVGDVRRQARAERKEKRKQAKENAKLERQAAKTEAIERRRVSGWDGDLYAHLADDQIKESKRSAKQRIKQEKRAAKKLSKLNKASKVGRLGGFASSMGSGLGKATKGVGKLTKGLGGAAKIAGRLGTRLIPGIGTALMVADAGMMVYNNWDSIEAGGKKALGWIKENAPKTWDKVKEGAGTMKDKVVDKFHDLKEGAGEKLNGLKDKIKGLFKDQSNPDGTPKLKAAGIGDIDDGPITRKFDELKEKAKGVWDGVKENWSTKWGEIKEGLVTKWDEIKTGAHEKLTGIGESIGNAWDGVSNWWSTTWDTITQWLHGKWEGIKSNAVSVWTGAGDAIANAWDTVQNWWGTKWDTIKLTLEEKWNSIKTSAKTLWEGAGDTVGSAWDGVTNWWGTTWDTASTFLSEKWTGIKDTAATTWTGASELVNTAWDQVSPLWSGAWSNIQGVLTPIWDGIKSGAQNKFSDASNSVTSAWNEAQSSSSSTWGAIVAFVSSGMSNVVSFIQSGFASVVGAVVGHMAAFVSAIVSGFSQAVSHAASLPGRVRGAMGNLGGMLVSSGRALVQGFINGITSMIGAAASAASRVVSAVRSFFPFSPAKRGPFSGRGYTTYSGKALVKDFAAGMRSVSGVAAAAAGAVTNAAQKQFTQLSANPAESMHSFQKNKILEPVLKSNAEKIAKWREKDKKAEEDHQKRLGEIAKSKSKKKGESIAKADKELAEKRRKNREELEKSLEAPDYSDIDRSIQAYWIDGTSELLKDRLSKVIKESNLAGFMRKAALQATATGRKVFGDNPLFAKVEANVNSKHFAFAINKAITESGIAEIPVTVAISNLDQLKSDLGMGDGVISRALDQALTYDSNKSDSKAYRENETKTEIHYHVEDMNEAIRLEEKRRRKEAMRIR